MINFIAHDFWSAAWLGCLLGVGAYVMAFGGASSQRILACFVANWIGVRTLVTFWPDNNLLWIALDGATVMALVWYGRSMAANAVAVLFTLILGIDHLAAWGVAGFSQAAAASDLLGAIGLLICAGASHVDGGKLERRSADRFGLGCIGGHWGADHSASSWRPILARTGGSRQALGSNQEKVP